MASAKPRPPLPPGPYLVVGLARSGVAAALALRARGEEVIGCDAGAPGNPLLDEAARRLSAAGVEVHLDASGDALAARAGTLIKSPGVPQNAPLVRAAHGRGTPVVGELELAWRLLENEFVAVTGTNGKTTTTEWIGHIHRDAGLPVAVAGNVGTAASSLVGAVDPDATIVCEASSFQLEDTEAFAPEAAVAAEPRTRPPRPPRRASRTTSRRSCGSSPTRATTTRGSSGRARARGPWGVCPPRPVRRRTRRGAVRARGYLWWDERAADSSGRDRPAGTHNRQNAMAAAASASRAAIEIGAVVAGARARFAGVPHRLERIAEHRRRPVGQRLEGDERREHDRRAARRSRRRRPPDRRRPRQGAGLRAAGAAGRGALRGGLPDRRGGARARRRARGQPASRSRRRRPGARGRGGAGGGHARRDRAALAGVRELRPVPRLRGARRALPRARGGA